MSDDFMRNFKNSPTMKSIQHIQQMAEEQSAQQRAFDESTRKLSEQIGSRERTKAQRERETAESTKAMAVYAAQQHEENRRLRYLTNLLAFAVIFDVVNGTFDDHKWWTTLISLVAGAAGLGGALLVGKWRTKRAVTAAESD